MPCPIPRGGEQVHLLTAWQLEVSVAADVTDPSSRWGPVSNRPGNSSGTRQQFLSSRPSRFLVNHQATGSYWARRPDIVTSITSLRVQFHLTQSQIPSNFTRPV